MRINWISCFAIIALPLCSCASVGDTFEKAYFADHPAEREKYKEFRLTSISEELEREFKNIDKSLEEYYRDYREADEESRKKMNDEKTVLKIISDMKIGAKKDYEELERMLQEEDRLVYFHYFWNGDSQIGYMIFREDEIFKRLVWYE